MQTPPTSVIKIAMTIATIGRLTKNSDMRSGFLWARRYLRRRGLSRRRPLFRCDSQTFADFLPALHDHSVTWFQPVGHFPPRVDTLAHFHRTNAGFVVLVDNDDLIIALKLVHGFLRNDQRILFGVGDEVHFAELSRPQVVSRIWKCHFVPNRSGLYVEVSIERIKFSFVWIHFAVPENLRKLKAAYVCGALRRIRMARNKISERSFAGGNKSLDRVNLRNGCQCTARRPNEIAHLVVSEAGYSIDW